MDRRWGPIIFGASVLLPGAGCQSLTGAHERHLISDDVADDGRAGGAGANAGNTGGRGAMGGVPDGGGDASGGVTGSGGTAATNGMGGRDASGGVTGSGGTAATSGMGGESGADAGGSSGNANTATSCAELAVKFGVNQNGPRTIDRDGAGTEPPFEVFCMGMTIVGGGAATEFLILPRHNGNGHPDSNFVTFAGDSQDPPRPGTCPCPPLTKDFSAVRIDLGRLRIFAYDRSFATYRGDPFCHGSVAHPCCNGGITMFGEAASCVVAQDSSGSANIDLRGTPFHLAEGELFEALEASAAGSVQFSVDRKVATLRGGGLGSGYAPIHGELPLAFDTFTDACGTETPASVQCGAPGCVPALGCCTNGNEEPICNSSSPSLCEALGYRTELFCDDQADCSDGKVCCLTTVGNPLRSACKTDCFGKESQVCTTCRECGAGKTCVDNRCVARPF